MLENLEMEFKEMLSKLTGLEPTEIGDEDDLFKDLGIDSLKVIEIATQIERNYKVVVKDSQLARLRTVKDAVTFLRDLLEKKNA
ncbi:MAG: acyl carrier protein [Candidatus Omnitrophica bacterium]|jgi:acyl carrier protein|nr:acyl carrier protein [Candidatus Omnitrophota bacterium]MBI4982697.1 acyl carrier protein [Candidatus Omnitrophota bacterium]